MTGLDLSAGEELSSAFEPGLRKFYQGISGSYHAIALLLEFRPVWLRWPFSSLLSVGYKVSYKKAALDSVVSIVPLIVY